MADDTNPQNAGASQTEAAQALDDLTVLSNVQNQSLGNSGLNVMRSVDTTDSPLNLLATVHQGENVTPTLQQGAALGGAGIATTDVVIEGGAGHQQGGIAGLDGSVGAGVDASGAAGGAGGGHAAAAVQAGTVSAATGGAVSGGTIAGDNGAVHHAQTETFQHAAAPTAGAGGAAAAAAAAPGVAEAAAAPTADQQPVTTTTAAPQAEAPTIEVASTVTTHADHSVALDITVTPGASGDSIASITIADLPEGATLSAGTHNADGTWTLTQSQLTGLTLTPAENYTGEVNFTVSATDVNGTSSATSAPVSVDLAVEANPISVTASGGSGQENSGQFAGALSGHDAAGDSLSYSLATGQGAAAAHGSVTLGADGSYTYTPNANFAGSDSFQVQVSDGHGGTTVQTVTVAVEGPQIDSAAPASDFAGHSVSGTVAAHDVGGTNAVTFTEGTGPADGSVVVNADGSYTYTANQGYSGTDSFQVVASDGNGGTVTQTVTVTDAANPITATAAPVSDYAGNAVSGHVAATDLAGDSMTYSLATGQGAAPQHGSVVVNADGSYTYTANQGYAGADSFQVQVSDGHGGVTTQTVSVTDQANTITASTGGGTGQENAGTVGGIVSGGNAAGDSQTYSLATGAGAEPAHGSVTVAADGSYTYTPNANFAGSDSFQVQVSDGHGGTTTQTVTVSVEGPKFDSAAPASDFAGHSVSGTVAAHDVGGTNPVTFSEGAGPADGSVVVHADGTYTYTANQGYVGTDSFQVVASDGHGGTVSQTVTVTDNANPITATAAAPSDYAGHAVTGSVTATDAAGDQMSYGLASNGGPAHGSVTVEANGSYTYTANANYAGTDSFQVQVSDGHGGTTVQTVTVTDTANPITASATAAADVRGASATGTFTASDAAGDATSTTATAGHGNVTVNANGTYTYTETDHSFTGTDTVTFTTSDGHGGTTTSTATVSVGDGATIATSTTGAGSVYEGHSVSGAVTASDQFGDGMSYSLSGTGPAHGSVTVAANGSYTYTANDGATATSDSFQVKVSDGHGGTTVQTVTISDLANPTTTTAVDGADVRGASATGTFTASDAAGDSMSTTATAGHGNVTVNANGTYTYTETDHSFTGTDTVTFTTSDGHGGTTITTANVAVGDGAQFSTTTTGAGSVIEGHSVSGAVTSSDQFGDGMTYSLSGTGPAHGTVSLAANGSYTYTANDGATATSDSFQVKVSDGHGGTTVQTVTVSDQANPITASTSGGAGAEGSGNVTGHVVASDTAGDSMSYSLGSGQGASPAHGAVTVNTDGSYSYAPASGFAGTDSFQVQVSDGHGGTTVQTVTVTVTDPGVGSSAISASSVAEGSTVSISTASHFSAASGETLTYSASGLPSGVTINAQTGVISGTAHDAAFGANSITVTATDAHGMTATQNVSLTVTDPGVTGTSLGTVQVSDGQTVSIGTASHFSTADAGDALHYSAVLPTGLSINASTGVISGTISDAALDQLGTTTGSTTIPSGITEPTVINGYGQTATTVVGPVVDGETGGFALVGNKISGAVQAHDAAGDTMSYSLASGSTPAHGSVVVGADGSYTYTPNSGYVGADSFTVQVSDGHGHTINQSVQVTAETVTGHTYTTNATNATFSMSGNDHVVDAYIGGSGSSNSIVGSAWGANVLNVDNGLANLQHIQNIDLGYGGSNTILAGSGDETLNFSGITVNHATILAGSGHDVITGGAGNEVFGAGSGSDTFIGGTGNNTYVLQSGDNGQQDTFIGHGTSNSIVDSAWGSNTLHVADGVANLSGIKSIDLGYGGNNKIVIDGTGSHHVDFSGITINHATIVAGSGNDVIKGGAGNEVFAAGSGTDTFIGGTGNNTYILQSGDNGQTDTFFGHGTSNSIVDSAWGSNVMHVADGLTNLTGINSIDLGYGGQNTILAGGGSEVLNFSGITVSHATIMAGSGNDTITGGSGNETFGAGAGTDTFIGGTGNNTYVMQSGDNGQVDTIIGHGTSNAIVDSAWGSNTLRVSNNLTNLSGVTSIDLGYGGHNTILVDDVKTISVTATDNHGMTATQTLNVDINGGNTYENFSGITINHATIQAGAGNDTIIGGAGAETFAVGAGVDTITGGTGSNTYVLQTGDNGQTDTFIGAGTSNSIIDSAWGTNVMHVANNLTNLSGIQSIDLGYGGQNTIIADNGNDTLNFSGININHATILAGSGTDTITGGSGNETFGAGSGTDTFIGGTGNNTYVLQSGDNHQTDTFIGHGSSNSIVDSAWGSNTLHVTNNLTNLSGVTSIDLGYGGHNTITAGDGNVTLNFSGITVNHATILAGAGNDTITGGSGNETFGAGSGTDTFTGGSGNNTYVLQTGDNHQTDTFIGAGTSNSIVDSAWGTNVMHVDNNLTNLSNIQSIDLGYGGNNTIIADNGNDTLNFSGININHATILAGSGNDIITGGSGNETFGAGSGTDTFIGGTGNNTYVLQSGDNHQTDTIIGHGTSNSIVDSAWGTNVMHVDNHLGNLSGVQSIDLGYGGHNTILAGSGSQTLDFTGITVNHATIMAGSGNDVITGGAGAETFGAGAGTDTFIGGSGSNTYVLQSGDNGQTDTFIGHGTSNSIVDSAWGSNTLHVSDGLGNLSGIQSIDLGYGGHNTIQVADAGAGGQTLNFSGMTISHASISLGAGDASVTMGANDTILAGQGNDLFTFGAHSGASTVTGATAGGWTDTINLHTIGTGATFDVSVLDSSGHAVTNQSWTGQHVDSAAGADHTVNLTSGEHGTITVHNTDGSSDHITFTNIEKITF